MDYRVICFDFDNVIVNDSVSRFLTLFGSRIEKLKIEIEFLQDSMEPRKFFKVARKMAEMGKGLDYKYVSDMMLKRIKLNKGVKPVMKRLKDDGHKIVIVSTNDERFIRMVLKRDGVLRYVDHIYASRLVVKNGVLTGEIKGDVVKTEKKGAVKKVKNLFKVKEKNIVYIGDGLTDLPIMKMVGRSILFRPNLITKAEVLKDSMLRKMEREGRLFIVHENSLLHAMQFV
jgi:phosphoserine phosphatase